MLLPPVQLLGWIPAFSPSPLKRVGILPVEKRMRIALFASSVSIREIRGRKSSETGERGIIIAVIMIMIYTVLFYFGATGLTFSLVAKTFFNMY